MPNQSRTVEIRKNLLFIEERGKAILVEQDGRRVYLPRSMVGYLRKDTFGMSGRACVIRIPEWLAKEKNLSDL